MVWRRGLLGVAYRRSSAASAGLRESRERLQDSSFRLRSHFRTRREPRSLSVPFVELTKIEVSRGRRSRGQAAWTKAKWGALIGAVPGAISLGLQHEQVGENGSSVAEAVAAWGVVRRVVRWSHWRRDWSH